MKATHVPGPWTDHPGTTTGRIVVAPDQPKVRRNIAACGGPNRDANARLIAAAPDMAKRLQQALDMLETFDGTEATCACIRKTLAKALPTSEEAGA